MQDGSSRGPGLKSLPQCPDLPAGQLTVFLPEPQVEGSTGPEAQSPPAPPTPVKFILRRMSNRLMRLDLSSPTPHRSSSLPSTPPSSPKSTSSRMLHVAYLRRKYSLSAPDLTDTTQDEAAPSYNSALNQLQSPIPACPTLKSSLSLRHIPAPSSLPIGCFLWEVQASTRVNNTTYPVVITRSDSSTVSVIQTELYARQNTTRHFIYCSRLTKPSIPA